MSNIKNLLKTKEILPYILIETLTVLYNKWINQSILILFAIKEGQAPKILEVLMKSKDKYNLPYS